MKSEYEYRAIAREKLGGKIFGSTWMYGVLVALIVSAVDGILASGKFTAVLTFVTLGFWSFGISGIFLRLVRGEEDIRVGRLFDARINPGKPILLGVMESIYVFLWSLLLIVPGIMKAYSYSMAFYVLQDNPEYTWQDCLDVSTQIMRGHRMELFCLHLSFIGWYLVSILTLGLGFFWVDPYVKTATAAFYEDIKDTPVVLRAPKA